MKWEKRQQKKQLRERSQRDLDKLNKRRSTLGLEPRKKSPPIDTTGWDLFEKGYLLIRTLKLRSSWIPRLKTLESVEEIYQYVMERYRWAYEPLLLGGTLTTFEYQELLAALIYLGIPIHPHFVGEEVENPSLTSWDLEEALFS